MGSLDYIVIGVYFLFVFGIAWYVSYKEKFGDDSSSYFLGGRDLGWFAIGASLFASNIGSEHLIGLAGSGARGFFPEAQFEILAALILLLLGWVFVPFYMKSGVFTMPEFLEKRYNSGARMYLSIISILSYVLTKISFTVFAGALVFEVLLGIPFWQGALFVVIATGIYTIFGGLKAVIYTDMVQSIIFILGGVCVAYFGLQAIGGWENMLSAIEVGTQRQAEAWKASGEVGDAPQTAAQYLSLWNNHEKYPLDAILLGAPILGIWYWCTDQFIVQRVLSAKNISHARRGTIFGGFLKLLPLFIFVIPGVIAYALSVDLYPDLFTVTNPVTGTKETTTDVALPAMVLNILPMGVRGLVVAGFLAALMSSLSSVFNSTSTLFTFDFYKKWRPNASEATLVNVGRGATMVLVAIGVLWIPLMRKLTEGGGLYTYLQSVQAYISPPIAAAFLLGIFYKRINGKGALVALWTGFILGIGRLILEFKNDLAIKSGSSPFIGEEGLIGYLVHMNFLRYAIFLFVVCSILMLAVSLLTGSKDHPKPITANGTRIFTREDLRSPEFALSILLVVAVLGIWLWF
jgi:SSS family solute:Na+ symporter